MEYCRIYLNNKFDKTIGVTCGLEELPEISDAGCPKFDIDQKEVAEINDRRTEYMKEERKSLIKDVLGTLHWLVPLIALAIWGLYRSFALSSDFRYTIAKVRIENQSGWGSKFLWFGGISKEFNYTYRINGQYYTVSKEFKHEEKPGLPSKFLIKYSPEDPENSEIIREINVELFPLSKTPMNGISPDSLDFVLNDLINGK